MLWCVVLAGGVTTMVSAAACNITGDSQDGLLLFYNSKGELIAGFCNKQTPDKK